MVLISILSILVLIGLCVVLVVVKGQRTKAILVRCGLPTIFWRPRFMDYRPFEENKKLAQSTITRILPRMEKLGGEYGMFGTVYGISTPVIHVAHPIPAKAILTGSSTITSKIHRRRSNSSMMNSTGASKAPAYNHFKNMFGNGVFTTDGQDWKSKRTAVMHCLIKGTASSTSVMSQKLEKEANRAADIFCHQIQSLNRQQNKDRRGDDCDVVSTNIVPLLQMATVGLIYRYLTHADPEWLLPVNILDCKSNDVNNNGDSKEKNSGTVSHSPSVDKIDIDASVVDEMSSSAATAASSLSSSSLLSSCFSPTEDRGLLNAYLSSIIRIRMIILAQSRSIWFLLPHWCYRLFSSLYRDEETTLDPIRKFAQQACRDARPESPLQRLRDSGDLYSSNSYSDQTSQNVSSWNTTLNKNLLDEVTTLLFAGQDTNAATLSWTLHLLSLHSKVQERLAKEVREVLNRNDNCAGNDVHSVTITRKEIAKFIYLNAVIKESMRLYPVAPFVVRRLAEEINIPTENNDDIISLPTGSVACLWIYSLHRNPKLWNHPDDFIPERWLDISLKDPGQTNGGYMPFASGPRNCLGQPLARIILRTILAKLIYQYKFTDARLRNEDENDTIDLRKEMQAGFTVLPTGGVHLEICSRTIENSKMN